LDSEQLKANIKSKKAFSLAINDKTMPPSIQRLNRMAQLMLLLLMTLATVEYALITKQYADTKENFNLIKLAYERTSEI
jgi:hypothetical protein